MKKLKMKKFLLKFLILFCFFAVMLLVNKAQAQNYDAWVFKEKVPVNEERRGLDMRHESVKWGGKKLAWASYFNFRFRDNYHKHNPRFIIRDKTTRLISNSKVSKKR